MTPTPLVVLEQFRAYLITAGIVQDWNATPGLIPGVALSPKDGAPLPRTDRGEQSTVTLRQIGNAIIQGEDDAARESSAIDITVRSTNSKTGTLIHRAIRGLVVPIGEYGGRKMWMMNDLLVERSFQWRQESDLLPAERLTGVLQRDLDTFDSVQAFMFECRRKVLDGLPYVP